MAQERGCEAHGLSGGLKYGKKEIFPGVCAVGTVLLGGKPGRNFPAGFFWLKCTLMTPEPAGGIFPPGSHFRKVRGSIISVLRPLC